MYIDFEDYRPETPRVETGDFCARRCPHLDNRPPFSSSSSDLRPPMSAAAPARGALVRAAQQRNRRGSCSWSRRSTFRSRSPSRTWTRPDQDRVASSVERAPDPKNSLPFARGNHAGARGGRSVAAPENKPQMSAAGRRECGTPESADRGADGVQRSRALVVEASRGAVHLAHVVDGPQRPPAASWATPSGTCSVTRSSSRSTTRREAATGRV